MIIDLSKKHKETDYVDIHLGYFKQGDDMSFCLEQDKNVINACRMHAQNMLSVAEHLNAVADCLEKHKDLLANVAIDACTHHIGMIAPTIITEELVKNGLAVKYEDEEDEEDEFDEEDNPDEDDEEFNEQNEEELEDLTDFS